MATALHSHLLHHLTDQDLLEEIQDTRWFLATVTRQDVSAGQIGRQRRHLEALQAEQRRRRELPRGERLAEAARQFALLARDAAEAAELDGEATMAVAAEALQDQANRALSLADRAWARLA